MYRAMQIANYIIHLSLTDRIDVTNLHLQKILYYLQAKSLYHTDEPLFIDNIVKWRLGPVVPNVHHEYKEYGLQPIKRIADEIVFDEENLDTKTVRFDVGHVSGKTKDNINQTAITLLYKDPLHNVKVNRQKTPY
jgi:uncharacterized phage-associated protein